MTDLAERIRTRLLPALLTAFGVTMLAAGLLSLTGGVTADSLVTPSPAVATAPPTVAPLITLPPITSYSCEVESFEVRAKTLFCNDCNWF